MTSVTFRVQDKDQKHLPLFPELEGELSPVPGALEKIALIQEATAEGKPGLYLLIRHDDRLLAVTLTAAMFLTLSAGIKGTMERWGEPWDGA